MRTGMREDSADKTAGASINRSMTLGQWGMLAMLSIIWGGSFFFIGVAVADIPPLTIVAIRVLLAAMVLWLIMVALRQSMPRDPSIWGTFFLYGVFEQCFAVQPDCLGADIYIVRVGFHP